MRTFASMISISMLLCACSKPAETVAASPSNSAAPAAVSAPPAVAAAATAAATKGPSLLRLKATVKDEPFNSAPACMVTFTIENLHDKQLVVFSADFIPTQASTGKVLTTATAFAGLRAGVANVPLAPGATGNPWKQNVLGAGCDDVAVRFEGRFLCTFQGQACTGANIAMQSEGLASMTGLGL